MRTDRGLDRLITFLDAVVAIAITLLVLPLADVLSGSAHRSLGGVCSADADQFGAFPLSFAVIARLWQAHHRMVEQVGAYDTAFLIVKPGWLLPIVVLPFASQVPAPVGRPASQPSMPSRGFRQRASSIRSCPMPGYSCSSAP